MTVANNLTAFMPTFYTGLNKVQQEQTDLIDACNMNAILEEAVVGQSINYPIAAAATIIDTPSAAVPSADGQTAGSGSLSLSKSKSAIIQYNGEEIQQLQLGGIYATYYADQLAQAVRSLRKLVSADIVTAGVQGACRAVGTANATPFASVNVLTDFANPNKVFNDNGSPSTDRHLILNSAAVANIQGIQATLFRANEAGTDRQLRTGTIGQVAGLNVGLDVMLQNIPTTSFGATGVAALNGAVTVGQTVIPVTVNPCTISGTPQAGDIFTIAGDTEHLYVVKSYTTGSLTIQNPGIMKAISSAAAVITFNSTTFTPNLFFTRDAITLIARQPRLAYSGPQGQLLDKEVLPDPRSGLTYQLAMWQAGRSVIIEVALVWGVAVTNSQDLGILLG